MNPHDLPYSFQLISLIILTFPVTLAKAIQTVYQTITQTDFEGPCQTAYGGSAVEIVVVDPWYINTFVAQNMTFRVDDGLTVTVDNAPTSFDTVTYRTSTLTTTNSAAL